MYVVNILNFCENYTKTVDQLKDNYIKENLSVKKYLPISMKDVLSTKLIEVSCFDVEDKKDNNGNVVLLENGEIGRRRTNNLNINSFVQYILFLRIMIENYTDLKSETDTFFEEYDALVQSGLLNKLVLGNPETGESPLIPLSEINEFKMLVKMKQDDAILNYGSTKYLIENATEKISKSFDAFLKPGLEEISYKLERMNKNKSKKIFK